MYGVGIYDHDITFGPEGAQSQLDVGKGVASHTSLAVVVLHARGHKFGCVGIHRDVAEVYVVDTVTWLAVVLLTEEHAQVEEAAALYALDADAVESDVAYVVLVATLNGQKPLFAAVEDVAVVDAHVLKHFSLWSAVVAVTADVDGVCHIGPEDTATDVDVLATSPVPPPMVVEGYAVVTGTQEAVVHPHTPAAHEVDAVGPRTGRERLQVANDDVLALAAIDGVVCRIEHSDAIDKYVAGVCDFDATQGMVEYATTDDAHVLGPIDDETGLDHGSGGQEDGAVGGYLYLLAWEVLGPVHAGTEIDEAGILHEHILRVGSLPTDGLGLVGSMVLGKGGVGQYMEVVQAVATELDAQVFGFREFYLHNAVVDTSALYPARMGTYVAGLILFFPVIDDAENRRLGHVELGKGCRLDTACIDIAAQNGNPRPGLGGTALGTRPHFVVVVGCRAVLLGQWTETDGLGLVGNEGCYSLALKPWEENQNGEQEGEDVESFHE